MPSKEQLGEDNEYLDRLKDTIVLPTPREACDWLEIRPKEYSGWVQARLEGELEVVNTSARPFRDRDDEESINLVRQIETRAAELRRLIEAWAGR